MLAVAVVELNAVEREWRRCLPFVVVSVVAAVVGVDDVEWSHRF